MPLLRCRSLVKQFRATTPSLSLAIDLLSHQAQHPAKRLAITDEASPFALRSTRKSSEESNAPRRRLAAGEATQQPPVVQPAVSRSGRWPHAEPSWLPSAARAAHSNTLWRPSGVVLPRMSGRPPCLGRPVRVFRQRRPVQRPPVQRLASGACPASACPVSRVRCRASGVRCPVSVSSVQCPVSRVDVGCPVSDASVRHSCVSRLCPLCPHR
jgi:hypothetical protein